MNNSFEGITLDNRFELIAEIGSGGMGRVFKARQIGLERLVAIKILDPVLNFDPEILSRFEREARSISVLKHAHIAAFYHYGMHLDSMPYIAMEFLNGASLRQEISEDGIDWPRTLRIARQICDAMAYAHQNGVIHRDLKPNNIILLSEPEADWVKILDFGLAKIASLTESGKQKLTKTGELIGSVNYLSPEQCLGRKTDGRSDIYSLSCVIFEMLTGQTPFDSDNPLGQIHKHVNEIAPLVSEVQKTRIIPPGIDLVVQKGLAKLPEDRYQTMEELSSDLQKVHEGKIDELLANSEKKAAKSKPNKLRLPLGIAVGAVLLLLVAAYIYVLNFTGAGLIYQIQSDLSKDNSERKRMTWLTKADKAEEAGKKESAGLIITELSRTVSVNENNTFSLARLYLAHAKECLKAGNRKEAGKWAMKSLTKMLEYERPKPQRTIDYLKMLEDSSTVALVTPDKISKQDAKKIDHIARPMIDVKGTAIISLAELYDRAFQDNHIPPTEALADTLTFAVKLLASQGNDKSFQRLFPRAERATELILHICRHYILEQHQI